MKFELLAEILGIRNWATLAENSDSRLDEMDEVALNELFNDEKAVDFKVRDDSYEWTGTAKLSNRNTLEVNCQRHDKMGSIPLWDIVFSVNGKYDLTRAGNEVEVLSTVHAILRQFQRDCDPKLVSMAADSASRERLYAHMLKRGLPGWKVISFKDNEEKAYRIAAVEGSEFPVERWGSSYLIRLAQGLMVGYDYGGGESHNLKKFPDLKVKLQSELKKAKEKVDAA